MRKKNYIAYLLSTVLTFNGFVCNIINAENEDSTEDNKSIEYCEGVLPISEEEMEEFKARVPEIVDVKLNSRAIESMKEQSSESIELFNSIEVAELGSEIITNKDAEGQLLELSSVSEITLPDKKDVPEEYLSFPEIGNQGDLNSCAGWSLAYYQLTNNIANVRGYDVKNSENPEQYIMSPMWVYNLINGGGNNATYFEDGMEVVCSYGCALWDDCPGSTEIADIESWHPGAELWEKALSNKVVEYDFLYLNDLEDIDKAKKILCNGYVLSLLTKMDPYYSNWNTMNRSDKVDSNEEVCYYVESKDINGEVAGGHFMTLVGYDDNVWVDVNGNKTKDTGETGAFKIANSWGEGFSNDGYIWLLYDALNIETTITNVNNQEDRINAIIGDVLFFLKPNTSYTPLLLGEVTINTEKRNQLGVEIGISETTDINPRVVTSVAKNIGNNIAFDYPNVYIESEDENDKMLGLGENFIGSEEMAEGTFVFDLSPIAKQYYTNMEKGEEYRFYINLTDNTNDEYLSQLTGFRVIDRRNDIVIDSMPELPLTANGSTAQAYADCKVTPEIATNDKHFEIKFNTSLMESTINSNNIYVKDVEGNKVNVNLTTNSEDNTVIIDAPDVGYSSGSFYYLIIEKGLLSQGGNALTSLVDFEFYVP